MSADEVLPEVPVVVCTQVRCPKCDVATRPAPPAGVVECIVCLTRYRVVDAPVTAEQITTAAELDALPVGSIVISERDIGWHKMRDGRWLSETGIAWSAAVLMEMVDSVILYCPAPQVDEGAEAARRVIRAALVHNAFRDGLPMATVAVPVEALTALLNERNVSPSRSDAAAPQVDEGAAREPWRGVLIDTAQDALDNDGGYLFADERAQIVSAVAVARAGMAEGVQPGCTGASDCPAPAHLHGCYADMRGTCSEPGEHLVPARRDGAPAASLRTEWGVRYPSGWVRQLDEGVARHVCDLPRIDGTEIALVRREVTDWQEVRDGE